MCHSGNQYLQKLGQGHHLVYSPKIVWSCIKISCKKYFCFWIDRFNGEFIFAFFAISFENIFSIFIVREPDYNGSWRVFTPDMMCSLDLDGSFISVKVFIDAISPSGLRLSPRFITFIIDP